MHPLAGDFSQLSDSDIESKITDLTKKYFMTNNEGMKMQISSLLDDYNNEIKKRRQLQLEKLMANRDKTLDKLIKVS
jgi:hypothetical protein